MEEQSGNPAAPHPEADHQMQPQTGQQEKKPKKMSPRKKRFIIIGGVVLAVVLIVAGVFYWLYARQYEETDDAYIDGYVSKIAPQVPGRIESLRVADNEQVKVGQVLAQIDPSDYEVRLEQARAQESQAKAQVALEAAVVGQSEANLKAAEASWFEASRDAERYRDVDPRAVTKEQRDHAIAAAKSASAQFMAARKAVAAAEAQKSAAQAAARQAEAAITNAELQLSYTKIIAPVDGRITERTVDVGNVVSAGQPLFAIVSNDVWVTANFKETQLTYMRPGQKTTIEVDAYPQVKFNGHVDSIQRGTGSAFSALPPENATGNWVKVVQRVPVKIVFDIPKQRRHYPLAPGLSVEPTVKVR